MLSEVSWSEYLIGAGILLAAYYLFVILGYYRKELQQVLSGKFRKAPGNDQNGSSPDNSFDELEMVVNDLRYAIFEKAGITADKQYLVAQLKTRLENYEGLAKPAYRVAINNYIIQNAKDICGVAFSEDELNAVWDSLPR